MLETDLWTVLACPHAMNRILNTQTNTAHKHRPDDSSRTTECGSLVTATHDRTQIISDEDVEMSASIHRCSRCFDVSNGY